MNFEWDADKAQINITKHQVRFKVATGVFADPDRITAKDERFDYGEDRYVTLGMAQDGVLVVVTTNRDEGRTIRIISARKASTAERRAYDDR